MGSPQVVGLMGPAGAGKDTVCQMIRDEYSNQGLEPPVRVAFADKIKQFAYAVDPMVRVDRVDRVDQFVRVSELVDAIGWERAKNENADVRRLLQRLGTEGGRRTLNEHVWVDAVYGDIVDYMDSGKSVIITDVRFPNEIQFLNEWGGELWKIERASAETGNSHESEAAWRMAVPNVIIVNDGPLEELEVAVHATLWT